jgi:gliding motility-associated-like protein
MPDSIIKIYDRYGKLLKKYKVSDPAWDGTYLGKHLRSDDYWYVIELIPINKTLKGHLTLKR